MNSSSIVRHSFDQPLGERGAISATPMREYRRNRQHLYPLEDYQDALARGGTVRSYCGLDATFLRGSPAGVEEVKEPESEDCVTCVDVWRGRQWVRL